MASTPTTVASGVEARWVATDSVGNVFVSDESDSTIYEVSGNTSITGATVGESAQVQTTAHQAGGSGGMDSVWGRTPSGFGI